MQHRVCCRALWYGRIRVHTNCPLLFQTKFFIIFFQMEMTVECPEAHKLKRISQKIFLSREKYNALIKKYFGQM